MFTRFVFLTLFLSLGAIIFLLPGEIIAQKNPKTLLYRITGSGISGDSYLMGTIHLKDPRVFDFPDSMYAAIEKCTAFAMEIHPDSLTEAMLGYSMNGKKEKLLEELIDPATMARLKKKYQRRFSRPIEKMTLMELIQLRKSPKEKKQSSGDEMATFMDMYLMDLAASSGKEILGLERAADQLEMIFNFTQSDDPERLLTAWIGDANTLPELVAAYISRDMDKIEAYVDNMPDSLKEIVLSQRNIIMLASMKKRMHDGSLFSAVGAAHLPGKNGLLKLLADEGYTLTPVMGSKNLHAAQYKPIQNPVEKEWEVIASSENGYRLLMPGKAAVNNIKESGIPMYTYVDWKRTEQYFFVHYPIYSVNSVSSRDSLVQAMLQASAKEMKAEIIEPLKPFKPGKIEGRSSVVLGSDGTFYFMAYFVEKNDVFFLMNGAAKRDSLQSDRMKKFRSSLEVLEKAATPSSLHYDAVSGFEINFPGKPYLKKEETEDTLALANQYYLRQGTSEYMVTVNSAGKLKGFQDDSLVFNAMGNNIKSGMEEGFLEEKGIEWLGYPAYRLSGLMTNGIAMDFRSLLRGNRVYTISCFNTSELYNEKDADAFFASFKLLPYQQEVLDWQTIGNLKLFTSPSSPAGYEKDEAGATDSSMIYSYLPSFYGTFVIETIKIDENTWAENDSVFLENRFNKYYAEDLISRSSTSFQTGKNYSSIDISYSRKRTHHLNRKKMIKWGDDLYLLLLDIDNEAMAMPEVSMLFDSLVFLGKYTPFDLTKQSAAAYLQKFDTAGEESFGKLVYGLDELTFYKSDKETLFSYAMKSFPGDTLYNPSLKNKIWSLLDELADESDVDKLAQMHQSSSENGDLQLKIISLLAKIGSPASLTVVKDQLPSMLLTDMYIYSVINELEENKEAASVLFPDWLEFLDDEKFGPAILYLFKTYLDSGFVNANPPGFEEKVLVLGKKIYHGVMSDSEYELPYKAAFLESLASIKDPDAFKLLNDFSILDEPFTYLSYLAVEALVNKGEKPVLGLEKLASSKVWRSSVLELLEETQKMELFPAAYANQTSMAEAFLMDALDDEMPDTMILVGKREVSFMGKKGRFFLYKIGFQYENEWEYYLGVSGPFELDPKSFVVHEGVYSEARVLKESFNTKKVDKQFSAWLKEMEDYLKELEEE